MGAETDKAANEQELRASLARLLSSSTFSRSPKISRLLSYLVEETINGRADGLKETSIAIEVFDQPADFNPRSNPIVRVNASRLRNLLRLYYSDAGRLEPLQIQLAPVGYIPEFRCMDLAAQFDSDEGNAGSPHAGANAPEISVAGESGVAPSGKMKIDRDAVSHLRPWSADAPYQPMQAGFDAQAKSQSRSNWFRGAMGAPASVALVIVNLVIAILFAALHNGAMAGKTDGGKTAEGLTVMSVSEAGSFLLLCRNNEPKAVRAGSIDRTIALSVHGKIVTCEPILQSASMVVSDSQ